MVELTHDDIAALVALRKTLHQWPEISGQEAQTAARVAEHLRDTQPDALLTGLAGHGVAAVYRGRSPGPRLLFRCELDALPIQESTRPHSSNAPGVAHLCGHDGHIAILLGLARLLGRHRPSRGQVALMFQPAEETGAGGPAVVADPAFDQVKPDFAYALHNIPGLPLGKVGLTTGPVASASRGMEITFHGSESHSAYPENARSPRAALAQLMVSLTELSTAFGEGFRRVTVTHVRMGQHNFGITPGDGLLCATLRTQTNSGMAELVSEAEVQVAKAAAEAQVTYDIAFHEIFEHLENNPQAVSHLERALRTCGIPFDTDGGTMVPSEDFAAFSHVAPSAMLYLGAGETHPPLHTPDYDFPDALIPIGAHLFAQVVQDQLG